MIAESNSVDVDMKRQTWLEVGIPLAGIIPYTMQKRENNEKHPHCADASEGRSNMCRGC
jgi:hypothetical protein